MADGTKIEWTDSSWNPIRARNRETGKVGWFCIHESEGCRHCYSEAINRRLGTGIDFKAQNREKVEIFLDEEMLTQPLRWKRPRRIFVCSMTDLFGEWVTDEITDRIFAVMALCPHHVFQVLTKRAERMRDYCRDEQTPFRVAKQIDRIEVQREIDALTEEVKLISGYEGYFVSNLGKILSSNGSSVCAYCGSSVEGIATKRYCSEKCRQISWYHRNRGKTDRYEPTLEWPLRNCWKGVSVEDQPRADERIPLLLDTPAAVRWLSIEPMLGPVDLSALPGISWIVVGGESGPGARPFKIEWARNIVAQCRMAFVPVFLKQLGAVPIIEDERSFNGGFPDGTHFGNRTGIRELNGLQALLRDRKGGAMEEWAPDLRVREYPAQERA